MSLEINKDELKASSGVWDFLSTLEPLVLIERLKAFSNTVIILAHLSFVKQVSGLC